jgi:hypothetical protein
MNTRSKSIKAREINTPLCINVIEETESIARDCVSNQEILIYSCKILNKIENNEKRFLRFGIIGETIFGTPGHLEKMKLFKTFKECYEYRKDIVDCKLHDYGYKYVKMFVILNSGEIHTLSETIDNGMDTELIDFYYNSLK